MKKNVCSCGYNGDEWLSFHSDVSGGSAQYPPSGYLYAKGKKDIGNFKYRITRCNKFIVCPVCGQIKADVAHIKKETWEDTDAKTKYEKKLEEENKRKEEEEKRRLEYEKRKAERDKKYREIREQKKKFYEENREIVIEFALNFFKEKGRKPTVREINVFINELMSK